MHDCLRSGEHGLHHAFQGVCGRRSMWAGSSARESAPCSLRVDCFVVGRVFGRAEGGTCRPRVSARAGTAGELSAAFRPDLDDHHAQRVGESRDIRPECDVHGRRGHSTGRGYTHRGSGVWPGALSRASYDVPVREVGGQFEATYTFAGVQPGTFTLEAAYLGDANFAASAITSLTETINPFPSTTTLFTDANPSALASRSLSRRLSATRRSTRY